MEYPGTELRVAAVKRSKWALAMLFVVDGVGFGAWAAHVPVFKQMLHLDTASLTFVLVSLIVGALVTMPLTGQFIQRYGSRRVIRIAAVLYVAMVALLAQAASLPALILFAGLYGAAKGAFDVAVNAQAVTVEKQYGLPIMSFFQGCWSTGGLFGAGAASLLLQHGGNGSQRPVDDRGGAHPVQPLGDASADKRGAGGGTRPLAATRSSSGPACPCYGLRGSPSLA